jgi:hypothetical protein
VFTRGLEHIFFGAEKRKKTGRDVLVGQDFQETGSHQAFSRSRRISFFIEWAAYSRQAWISSFVKWG